MHQKINGFVTIGLLAIIMLALVVGGGVFYFSRSTPVSVATVTNSTNGNTSFQSAPTIPTGWNVYTNTTYHYSIAYPPHLSIFTGSSSTDHVSFGNGGFNLTVKISKDSTNANTLIQEQIATLSGESSASGLTSTYTVADTTAAGMSGKLITINFSNADGSPSHVLAESYFNSGDTLIQFACFYEPNSQLLPSIKKYVTSPDLGAEYGYNCSTLSQMISTFSFTKTSA